MAKKIAATLNLTQALEDFHSTVVPLLEIAEMALPPDKFSPWAMSV